MSDSDIFGRFKRKLIESKQKWAADGRLLTGAAGDRTVDRLPPGQHEVKNWPVLDLGVQPKIELWEWTLEIAGLVETPVTWTWQDFLGMPQTTDVSDIHCVTAWSRFDNQWQGVSSADLIAAVKPRHEAHFVLFTSHDGYTTNLRLDQFADRDVLLAHSWQGEPITRQHGGPVRVIVPKFYFWKSAKWVKRIEFVAKDKLGFWENRGYHNNADPWDEERYS